MRTVVESSIFEAEKSRYWSNEEFLEFASWIACNPQAGEVVPGLEVFGKFGGKPKGLANAVVFVSSISLASRTLFT